MPLSGSEKYLRPGEDAPRKALTPAQKLIEQADEISIFKILHDFFGLELPQMSKSFKAKCPFGTEHDDGGLDKGWRVYPESNSSMCFPLHGQMGPTRLVSIERGISMPRAAELMLDRYGLRKPVTYRQKYNDVLLSQERKEAPRRGSQADAAAALIMSLRQIPGYIEHQYDDDVLSAVAQSNEDLEAVLKTPGHALDQWHARSVATVRQTLERKFSDY